MASIFAQQNGWDGADGAPEWLVELVQDVANALATQPPAPVQQNEAVAWSHTDMTLWRSTVEMLVDVYFDGVENAPGEGAYVSGTLDQAMSESRALLKRTPLGVCKNCDGTGDDCDSGDDGRAITVQCGFCNGSGRATPPAPAQAEIDALRAELAALKAALNPPDHTPPTGVFVQAAQDDQARDAGRPTTDKQIEAEFWRQEFPCVDTSHRTTVLSLWIQRGFFIKGWKAAIAATKETP